MKIDNSSTYHAWAVVVYDDHPPKEEHNPKQLRTSPALYVKLCFVLQVQHKPTPQTPALPTPNSKPKMPEEEPR